MDVLLFGTGVYYERCKRFFYEQCVVALLDNDDRKIGTRKDGILVLSPEDGIKLSYHKIFILSASFREMHNQLIHLGVTKDRICTVYDIGILFGIPKNRSCLQIYGRDLWPVFSNMNKRKIAILTYGMGISGGDFAVLLLAKKLHKKYNIHIISWIDGPLRNQFLELGIPVIIDSDLVVETIKDIRNKELYDLFIVNGAAFYTLFLQGTEEISKNVIWWIHSSGSMHDEISLWRLNTIPQGSVFVYGVSERAVASLKEVIPSWKIDRLCYGVKDVDTNHSIENPSIEKIVFALVASCQPRKAQDVFLDAIEQLSSEKQMKCEFWIIGSMGETEFSRTICKRAGDIENVKILGTFTNRELQQIYGKISVLVCPSLEDTMPIVCAEAMMHHHPCIVSDYVGTAEYINPEKNGLICKTGDATDLTSKIEWMIDHSDHIPAMGREARKTYEQYFSMEVFEQELLMLVEDKIVY